jgi:hypothetical protein
MSIKFIEETNIKPNIKFKKKKVLINFLNEIFPTNSDPKTNNSPVIIPIIGCKKPEKIIFITKILRNIYT